MHFTLNFKVLPSILIQSKLIIGIVLQILDKQHCNELPLLYEESSAIKKQVQLAASSAEVSMWGYSINHQSFTLQFFSVALVHFLHHY